ncbi:hypothetical protein ACMV5L_14310 [Serratia plymuthica]|uniref:hypothetical protein n=1 Tax=Serratia plymuthica TaxID=82996 RepID=UPI003DA54A94
MTDSNYEKNHTIPYPADSLPTRRDIFLGILRDSILSVDEFKKRMMGYPAYAKRSAQEALEQFLLEQ